MASSATVADVMTSRVIGVPADAPITAAAEAMRDNDVGDVLVVADGAIQGVVTDRDLTVRVLGGGLDPVTTTAADVCSSDLVSTRPDATIHEAAQVMRDNAVRRLPVVDGQGHAVGIVSLGDLATVGDPTSALADISAAPPNA